METFQTELLLAICYCHLPLSVPKMMHLSLNPHLPKPQWELNWHSRANSPATDHRTISVTMIPHPDSFQSFGNNRWVVKLKSVNKKDNIDMIRNWSFPQATSSLLAFLATYHITNWNAFCLHSFLWYQICFEWPFFILLCNNYNHRITLCYGYIFIGISKT